jgi:UDPglucose--hexose-1-phosphate uridylyltransferase
VSSEGWFEKPHRRYNALSGEWLLVSPQRTQRPWQGETAASVRDERPRYDPSCYLCPGNARFGGERNPAYEGTYVFDNDYPALLPDIPSGERNDDGLFVARTERGRSRVVCFSPRHDLSVAKMSTGAIRGVVDAWAEEYQRLGADPAIGSVIVFENHGEMMGASNPHPHAQIWATQSLPNEPAKERAALSAYRAAHGTCLLCTYAEREIALEERVVFANEHVVIVVPFWAVWPFETLVIPRRHRPSLDALAGEEREALADAMRTITATYDRVFDAPFPYSMGFHQAPTGDEPADESHLHAHYYPPLLRSETVRKYMVGFELLGMPQRDITPETAANRLRDLVLSAGDEA